MKKGTIEIMAENKEMTTLKDFHEDINKLLPYFNANYFNVLKKYKNICLAVVIKYSGSNVYVFHKFDFNLLNHIVKFSVDFDNYCNYVLFECLKNFDKDQKEYLQKVIVKKYKHILDIEDYFKEKSKYCIAYRNSEGETVDGEYSNYDVEFISLFYKLGYDINFLENVYNSDYFKNNHNSDLLRFLITNGFEDKIKVIKKQPSLRRSLSFNDKTCIII